MPDVPAMIEVFIIVDLFYILLNSFVCLFMPFFSVNFLQINLALENKIKKGVYCLLFLYGETNQKSLKLENQFIFLFLLLIGVYERFYI